MNGRSKNHNCRKAIEVFHYCIREIKPTSGMNRETLSFNIGASYKK